MCWSTGGLCSQPFSWPSSPLLLSDICWRHTNFFLKWDPCGCEDYGWSTWWTLGNNGSSLTATLPLSVMVCPTKLCWVGLHSASSELQTCEKCSLTKAKLPSRFLRGQWPLTRLPNRPFSLFLKCWGLHDGNSTCCMSTICAGRG